MFYINDKVEKPTCKQIILCLKISSKFNLKFVPRTKQEAWKFIHDHIKKYIESFPFNRENSFKEESGEDFYQWEYEDSEEYF